MDPVKPIFGTALEKVNDEAPFPIHTGRSNNTSAAIVQPSAPLSPVNRLGLTSPAKKNNDETFDSKQSLPQGSIGKKYVPCSQQRR